jgi:transposase
MTHLSGHDRSQLLLLPEAVDDYVGPDNPVRFIDAFVDGLDLAAASFIHVEPKVTGRPGYAPADLLKLYIYGYLNRLRSSRRLEAETHRNIEVIWLLRHLKPDFKTIADFRRDNRNAFRHVFRENGSLQIPTKSPADSEMMSPGVALPRLKCSRKLRCCLI